MKYSLKTIFSRFKMKIIFTMALVLLELITSLLFPLFIGDAINSLLEKKTEGLIALVVLTVVSLVIGAARRFIDSRVYAKVYRTIAMELMSDEEKKGSSTSVISARIHLLTELVEFFENSFPAIVSSFLGIIGILVIIFTINVKILFLCLAAIAGIVIVYGLTSKWNWKLNKAYNDQTELMVATVESRNRESMYGYFKKLMSVNIRLSDLETANFSVVTIISMAVFIMSMFVSIESGELNYGAIFSVLMYVFEFVEKSVVLPLYYQNFIRLQEISARLSEE